MVYTVREMAKLLGIGCMKKAGMSVKDIRQYIEMAPQGDDTIDLCLFLFEHQWGVMKRQMEELQHAMEMVDYKCWYYETAKAAGTVNAPQKKELSDVPERAGALSENSGRASDRTGQKHKVKDKAGANRYDR